MILRQVKNAVGGFIISSRTASTSSCPIRHRHRYHHCSLQYYFHTQVVHWTKSDTDGGDSISGNNEECVAGRQISFTPFLGETSPSSSSSSHTHNNDNDSVPTIVQALTVNDTTRSSTAFQLLRRGYRLIYTGGDYHNARQLLRAVKHKISQTPSVSASSLHSPTRTRKKNRTITRNENVKDNNEDVISIAQRQWTEMKHLQRTQSEITRRLLIKISLEVLLHDNNAIVSCGIVGLKRSPIHSKDVLQYAFLNEDMETMKKMMSTTGSIGDDGTSSTFFLSLTEFIGMIGGYEWHRKGVYIHAIQEYIYPHYGVFPPTRQDYIPLLNNIVVASGDDDGKIKIMHRRTTLLEVGIGSGILSIILLKQGKVDQVTGTDINSYAIACVRDNMHRLGLESRVHLLHTDLFPPIPPHSASTNNTVDEMRYDAVLFNPPWLPGDAPTYLDQAVYDPNQFVLRRFVYEVQHYVKKEDGCIYILLSNLGMLLGLFSEQDLHAMFDEGNLELVEVYHHHSRTKSDQLRKRNEQQKQHECDAIASARAREVISLYKLRVKRSR